MSLPWPNAETLQKLDDVLKKPKGRRIGVLGLGIAGKAMALHLVKRGAKVLGADRNPALDSAELTKAGVEVALGGTDDKTFAECEALAIAPGADPRQAAVTGAVRRGLPVFGELELVGNLRAKVAAITGTNGKSTTTALLGELVRAAGKKAFVGGNLGDPIIAWVDKDEEVDVAVIELSSFQLETAYRFSPDVSIVLNITPDHADRYGSIEAYAAAKQHALESMKESAVAVLSQDDARVAKMSRATKAKVWWFSTMSENIVGNGAVVQGDKLVPAGDLEGIGEIDLTHPRLFGRHNRENAVAAFLAGHALGLSKDAMLSGYTSFQGLEHRLEWVV
jgi:UDP-N-acetylmuramoylalanine--D-glutamate ligase